MRFGVHATVIASVSASVLPPSPGPIGNASKGVFEHPGSIQASPVPEEDPTWTKYFHEPGQDDQLGHYDARYFTDIVSYEERTDTQLHMIRAYLDFFRSNGLETWIAHGTLLGWWWNGRRLPWDWDLDVQVADATLRHLGQKYNQTVYSYDLYTTDAQGRTTRSYLLDINPWIWQRDRGDGMNIIDARWIDIRNGLFIDITGLSETDPQSEPGVWSCKNYHRYKVTELYPLRESLFEGARAMVPYNYEASLREEYGGVALVKREFEGHYWDLGGKEWRSGGGMGRGWRRWRW